jgi:hypothetical protein
MVTNLREALADWSWLRNTDELEIIDTTCLGDVILRDKADAELILDVGSGEIRPFDEKERELVSGQRAFIARMESHGLKLGQGQCYGLKPHFIFKDYEPGNMYVATTAEYVGFMGSFHGQINDLPNGATLRLKVINQKDIQ